MSILSRSQNDKSSLFEAPKKLQSPHESYLLTKKQILLFCILDLLYYTNLFLVAAWEYRRLCPSGQMLLSWERNK